MGAPLSFHRPHWPQIWDFWVAYGVDRMRLRHVRGCHPPQTASHIHVRFIQIVWVFGMLSLGHMGAPFLYHSTVQVGPRFGDSGSLMELKWCPYVMFEADIHLRPLPTSILDIFKVFEPLVCCLKGIWCTLAPFQWPSWPQVWEFWFAYIVMEWKWCHYNIVEAAILFKLLPASILDIIYKVFDNIGMLKGI